MTPFDLFQLATCQISDGDRAKAAATLTRAIRIIDSGRKEGLADAYMRDDLADLRYSLVNHAEAHAAWITRDSARAIRAQVSA